MKPQTPEPKVLVSGCFDMLHSGHIAFLTQAATYGKLYVCIGSDKNVYMLKSKQTIVREQQRKYMIDVLKCVYQCRISRGIGYLDFVQEMKEIKPDIFFVNDDGDRPEKRQLCQSMGIQYKVSKRFGETQILWPYRSTTQQRKQCLIPYRIQIAGGWLDQPYISKLHPGSVLTISIQPTIQFNDASGMATSTRKKAIQLWQTQLPYTNNLKTAKILFSYQNPPGKKQIAGSQDSLGIVLPGLNRLYYNGQYWPEKIQDVNDQGILDWIEKYLYLIQLGPRQENYDVLSKTNFTVQGVERLSVAVEKCWNAILKKDVYGLGESFTENFEAQINLFPLMLNSLIEEKINEYKDDILGYKVSGAGGGGYLVCIAQKPLKNGIQIKIRRKDWL